MKKTTCRICGKRSVHMDRLSWVETQFKEKYSLIECPNCSFITTVPLPDQKCLKKYYYDEYWTPNTSEPDSLVNRFYEARMSNCVSYLKKAVGKRANILDWGCGNGDFVKLLIKRGFKARGIDKYGNFPDDTKLFARKIEYFSLEKGSFDAITCYHVLEHLHDPVGEVKAILPYLRSGGVLIVELPNIDSFGFRFFGKNWQPLQLPTHLNHFSKNSIQELQNQVGLIETAGLYYFSNRASTASMVLSVFPKLTPKFVRSFNSGRYPIQKKIIYLLCQLSFFPFVLVETLLKKGGIMRVVFKKE